MHAQELFTYDKGLPKYATRTGCRSLSLTTRKSSCPELRLDDHLGQPGGRLPGAALGLAASIDSSSGRVYALRPLAVLAAGRKERRQLPFAHDAECVEGKDSRRRDA